MIASYTLTKLLLTSKPKAKNRTNFMSCSSRSDDEYTLFYSQNKFFNTIKIYPGKISEKMVAKSDLICDECGMYVTYRC